MAPAQVHCSSNDKGEFTQVSCGGWGEGGSGGGCKWGGLHGGTGAGIKKPAEAGLWCYQGIGT